MAEGGADVDFGRDEQQKVREENDDDAVFDEEIDPNLDGLTQETSFGGVKRLGLEGSRNEVLKQKLNDFYSDVEKKTGHRLAIDLDPSQFKLAKGDILFAKWKTKWIQLTDKRDPYKFLSLSTIQNKTNVVLFKKF